MTTRAKPASADEQFRHIEFAIPPDGNSAIYQWQKYWGRKPHNVVREFIENYCPPNGVVLDPFVGSGITAIEALRAGRRALVCDLNPMSADIINATINPLNLDDFTKLALKARELTRDKVQALYSHKCKHCEGKVQILATSVNVISNNKVEPIELRYNCKCRDGLIREKIDESSYYNRFERQLDNEGIWWPDTKLEYANGEPFNKREKYQFYRDLFTPRNLLALAYIWDVIENRDWKSSEKRILQTLFRSFVHLCSRVSGDRRVRPLSAGWTQHSFWFAKNPVEINVWGAFDRKLTEYLAVITDWSSIRKTPVKIARTIDEVLSGKADIFFTTQDCASFLRAIANSKKKADYVFTDPPYNGMIQYGELSFMWNAWRSDMDNKTYLGNIEASELTENKGQHKKLPDYYQHLRAAFSQIADAVSPESYIHVTYSSPKVKYRNLTLRAARLAGLDFEKLHFQQSVRTSKKAIEQPFGSVFGDFIFRFFKPKSATVPARSRTQSLESIVNERTVYMLKHRGEATPINVITAECERELFKSGFFDDESALENDVEKIIKKSDRFKVDKEGLVAFKKGSEYEGTPLSLRVEKTVREMLTASRVVTYTDIWTELLKEYPNSLTPDSSSITTALKKFASPKKGGLWEAKQEVMRGKSTIHNRIILHCGKALQRKGFSLAVGKPEQSDGIFRGLSKSMGSIFNFLNKCETTGISKQDLKRITNIDLIAWTDKKESELVSTIYCIEVETTTNFIDAFERVAPLLRQKNLDVQFVIMIGSRLEELRNKMATKLTFQAIGNDLKRKVKIVAFDPSKSESFENLAFLTKKVKEAPTWLDLETLLAA